MAHLVAALVGHSHALTFPVSGQLFVHIHVPASMVPMMVLVMDSVVSVEEMARDVQLSLLPLWHQVRPDHRHPEICLSSSSCSYHLLVILNLIQSLIQMMMLMTMTLMVSPVSTLFEVRVDVEVAGMVIGSGHGMSQI